jgi:quinoprotein glucose dehydrogenase
MSASSDSELAPAPARHPLVSVLALLLIVIGAVLAAGGGWLLQLGGSWYYVVAGVGLLASGALLWRNLRSGAQLFALVFIGTLAWTWWESGGSYWRWVPRLGLVTALAVLVALLSSTLQRPVPKRIARITAAALALFFVAAFSVAFVPHGVTRAQPGFPQPLVAAGLAPTDAAPLQAADRPADGDWPAWGRSNAGTRFSPSRGITADNVATLQPAWVFRTGDLPRRRWGAETTPLKIGDSLYLCSARNQLIALDAATGTARWRFDPKVRDADIPHTAACRGVAYHETADQPSLDPLLADVAADLALPSALPGLPLPARTARAACAARIIEGTLDGRLIAVDAATGAACRGFGNNGQVDITVGMGEVAAGDVSISAPPAIVRGVIVTGHQVRNARGQDAVSGVIQGFDVITGKLRWAWDMQRPDRAGAPPAGHTYTRGTPTLVTTPTADDALGLVYVPLGSAAQDLRDGLHGAAAQRHASALVAIDVATGKPAWSFQTVRNEGAGDDLRSQPTLIDYPTPSGKVPAILLPTRQGDLYVLDRRSGAPLVAAEAGGVPRDGIQPAPRAPSQRFPRLHMLRRAALTERDMWGITPIDQLLCRIQFRLAQRDGASMPPGRADASIQYPGHNGGWDWGGVAVDPRRGVIVANYNDMPDYDAGGEGLMASLYAINPANGWRLPLTRLPCKQPPYGGIRAIDLRTGATLWDRPFGSARGLAPFGLRAGLPIEIGVPNQGGSVITASGLVFIAAATDDLLRAIDLETGRELWRAELPAGGQANPMVYAHNGRHYLVVMAGGDNRLQTPAGDYLLAYALPAKSGP